MSRKILGIILIGLLLVLSGITIYSSITSSPSTTNNPPPVNDPTAKWLVDTEVVNASSSQPQAFQIKYPSYLELVKPSSSNQIINFLGQPIVSYRFTENYFTSQKTNFGEAYFNISAGSDATSTTNCYLNPFTNTGLTQHQTINGIDYTWDNATDAAAGNLYTSKIYRTMQAGTCYEILETIHTGNIYNYPEGTVTEFDKTQVNSVFDNMLLTFKFATTGLIQ